MFCAFSNPFSSKDKTVIVTICVVYIFFYCHKLHYLFCLSIFYFFFFLSYTDILTSLGTRNFSLTCSQSLYGCESHCLCGAHNRLRRIKDKKKILVSSLVLVLWKFVNTKNKKCYNALIKVLPIFFFLLIYYIFT